MSRLEELLRDASEPDDLWSLDPAAIAREGRRRVVRKRWTRAGVAAAALVVVGGAVAVPLLHGAGPDDRVADSAAQGEYRDVTLSRAEMERRCTKELNERNGTDVRYVAGRAPDGTAVPSTGLPGYVETREGWAVQLIPKGHRWPKGMPLGTKAPSGPYITPAARRARLDEVSRVCTIPQAGATPGIDLSAVPETSDHAAIIEDCSRAAGYDFEGWSVLAAVKERSYEYPRPPASLEAILFSTNGHAAECWLYPDGTSGIGMIPRAYETSDGQPLLLPSDVDPARRYAVLAPSAGGALGIGVIPGLPDGWRIDVVTQGVAAAHVVTSHGGFAYSLEAAAGGRSWSVRIRDVEGNVIWQGALDLKGAPR